MFQPQYKGNRNLSRLQMLLMVSLTIAPIILFILLKSRFLVKGPPLLVALLSLIMLVWPGLALVAILHGKISEISVGEVLPLAFVLSLALLAIPAMLLRSNINLLIIILVALNVSLTPAAWMSIKYRPYATRVQWTDINPILIIYLFSLVGICFLAALNAPVDYDEWAHLANIRLYLDRPDSLITNGRIETITNYWLVLQAVAIELSGLEATLLCQTYLTPLLLPFSVSAFYALAKTLIPNKNFAIFSTTWLWTFFIATPLDRAVRPGLEIAALITLNMDKSLLRFILFPLASAHILKYILSGRKIDLILMGIICSVASLLHPLMYLIYPVGIATFLGFSFLITSDKKGTLFRSIPLLSIIVVTLIPSLYSWVAQSPLERVGGVTGNQLLFHASMNLDFFFLSRDIYIIHPRLLLQPEFVLAFLGVMILFKDLKHIRTQYLFATFVFPIGFLCILPLILLIFQVGAVDSALRLLWVAQAPFISSTVIWKYINTGKFSANSLLRRMLPILILLLVTVVLWGQSEQLRSWLYSRDTGGASQWYSIASPQEENLYKYIRENVHDGTILAESILNDRLRAYVPSHLYGSRAHSVAAYNVVNVINFRGTPVEDVWNERAFFSQSFLEYITLDVLTKYDVRYVIVVNGSQLSSQITQLVGDFNLLYENENFQFFKVIRFTQTARVIVANNHLLSKEYSQAVIEYEDLLKVYPNNFWLYLGLGQALEKQGEKENALHAYIRAAQIAPVDPWPYIFIGDYYKLRGEIKEATIHYKNAVELNPYYSQFHILLGDIYMRWAYLADAQSEFEKAIDTFYLHPGTASYYVALGDIYANQGWAAQAISNYELALHYKQDESLFLKLGSMYQLMHNFDEADKYYELASIENPWSAKPKLYKADLYAQQNRVIEAEVKYQEARRAQLLYPDIYSKEGAFYRQLGDEDKAIAAYEQIISFYPNPDTFFLLGQTYEHFGRLTEAFISYKSALLLMPLNQNYRETIVRLARTRSTILYDFIEHFSEAKTNSSQEKIHLDHFTVYGESRNIIYQHPESQIAFDVTIPISTSLQVGFTLSPQVWQPIYGDGVEFEVSIQQEGIPDPEIVFFHYTDPKNNVGDRRWIDTQIDLSRFANQDVKIILKTLPGRLGDDRYDWAGWSDPCLVFTDSKKTISWALKTWNMYYDFLAKLPFLSDYRDSGPQYARYDYLLIGDELRDILFQHSNSRVTYDKVYIQPTSTLQFGLGMDPVVWSPDKGDGAEYNIYVRRLDEPNRLYMVFQKYIDPKNNIQDRHWFDERLDLSQFSGQVVDIIFETLPGPAGNADFDWGGWSMPMLVSEAISSNGLEGIPAQSSEGTP